MRNLVVLAALLVFGIFTQAMAQTSYTLDPAHTSVHFTANHAGVGYTFGRFDVVDGGFEYDSANPENSSLQLFIPTESVNTNNSDRDEHLRGPDFFASSQFPTIEFVSTSITKIDDSTFEVTGDLTLHSETKEITIPVELTGEGENRQGKSIVGFYSEFEIDRTEFGMNNFRQADGGPVGDNIFLLVSLEGVAN